jgi:hypothetical protein
MAQNLQEYMRKYMQQQAESLKGCLMAVLDSREQYLSILDESLGTPIPSENIKLCELLTDAGLFREEVKVTRDGRNRYKVFYLTAPGREMAQQIKTEGYNGAVPQNTPLDNL